MEKQFSALLTDILLLPLMCIAISVRDVKCSTVQRLVPLEIPTVCQLIHSSLTQPLSFFFWQTRFSFLYILSDSFQICLAIFFYNCLFLVLFFNSIFYFLIILYPLFHNSKTWSPWESKYADCCFCLCLLMMALFPSLFGDFSVMSSYLIISYGPKLGPLSFWEKLHLLLPEGAKGAFWLPWRTPRLLWECWA